MRWPISFRIENGDDNMNDENQIPDSWICGAFVLAAVLIVVFLALMATLTNSPPPATSNEVTETCPAPVEPVVEPAPEPQPEPKPEPQPEPQPEPTTEKSCGCCTGCVCGDNCLCDQLGACCGGCKCSKWPTPLPDQEPDAPTDEPKPCACHSGCPCGDKCDCKPGYRVCGKDCKCTALAVPYVCEACGGTLYIGHAPGAKILPAYQCYRCPPNPNGKKPLMYRADVKRPAPVPPPPRQPRFPRFFGGFTDLYGGQFCSGSV